jgi:hypothetical protein
LNVLAVAVEPVLVAEALQIKGAAAVVAVARMRIGYLKRLI